MISIQIISHKGGTATGSGTFNTNATVTLTAISNSGYIFEGWYENNVKIPDATSTYTFTATNNRTLEARFIKNATYNITGKISSYNARNDITVALWQNGTPTSYSTTIQGQQTSENKRYEHTFILADVPDGAYDLVITKQGHLSYTIKNIVVSDSDIDLSSYVVNLVCGDVNGNGTVNLADISEIAKSTRFNKVESNKNGYDPKYDVNGNGVIELTDISIVFNSYNFQKTTNNCIIEFSEVLSKINPIFAD